MVQTASTVKCLLSQYKLWMNFRDLDEKYGQTVNQSTCRLPTEERIYTFDYRGQNGHSVPHGGMVSFIATAPCAEPSPNTCFCARSTPLDLFLRVLCVHIHILCLMWSQNKACFYRIFTLMICLTAGTELRAVIENMIRVGIGPLH